MTLLLLGIFLLAVDVVTGFGYWNRKKSCTFPYTVKVRIVNHKDITFFVDLDSGPSILSSCLERETFDHF